jgi:hypothetical protein
MSGQCEQRCLRDSNCPAEQICENLLCVPSQCDTNMDCTMAGQQCQNGMMGHGRCMMVVPCDAMGNCPANMQCNTATHQCQTLPPCGSDRDCTNNGYCQGGFCQPSTACMGGACPMGFDCVGMTCVPNVCRGDADCTNAQRCIGGACATPPATTNVTSVRIITPAGDVRPTTTYAFTAVAIDQAGNVVPGAVFTWASSNMAVATIVGTGVATGGTLAGTTQITASVNGITSMPVTLINLGAAPMGDIRVTVVSLANGGPIAGVSVRITGITNAPSVSGATDANGTALLAATPRASGYDVTAAKTGYDYVSVLGLSSTDVVIALPPVTKPSLVGGIKGNVDLSHVSTMGNLSLSLNGTSIASPIVGFDPSTLFGGDIFQVSIPGMGAKVPVPAGTTISVLFAGQNIPLKDTYYARATGGLRAAWSLGGHLDLSLLMGAGGNLTGALLPNLQRLDHGVKPVIDVLELPTVPDTNDINGNGNTTELVPDYNDFPTVTLAPDTPQELRYQLAVATLPAVSGGQANALIVVAGTLLPGVGFVPLGLDGQQTMTGTIAPFTTKIAPPHGGLEVGEYAVLATAVRLTTGALPSAGSTRLLVTSRLPESVDMSDHWLASPSAATWSAMNRQVTVPPVASAGFYRVAFASTDGAWDIYVASPAGPIAIPAVPSPALVDRTASATVSVDAIELSQGTTANSLFDVSTGGGLAIDRATRAFSRAVIGH